MNFIASVLEHPAAVLFAIIGVGYLLGNLQFRSVSLGASAILFVAMIFGHYGMKIPGAISDVGVVLFVYAIGLQAGPRFFNTFKKRGIPFAQIAILICATGALASYLAGLIFHVSPAVIVGIYTGALTSTPGLAAALDAFRDPAVSVGYGLAYPFGVVGVVLFVQVLPRLLKVSLTHEENLAAKDERANLTKRQFIVQNQNFTGKPLKHLNFHKLAAANFSRLKRAGEVRPVTSETIFELGDTVVAVGKKEDLDKLQLLIGPETEDHSLMRSLAVESRDIFITADAIAGKPISELNIGEQFGVTITRVRRDAMEFSPMGNFVLEIGDSVRVVGDPAGLEGFVRLAGQNEKRIHETNMLAMSTGIILGIVIAYMPLHLPGGLTIRLGLAGGPLLVSLIFAHFGRIGELNIRTPYAAKYILRELGLALFLAGAGITAGQEAGSVMGSQGLVLLLVGAVVTIVPMVIGYLVARFYFKFDLLTILGVICGGMTSTPALGAISTTTASERPALAYASVYPVALIAVTVLSQLLGILFQAK